MSASTAAPPANRKGSHAEREYPADWMLFVVTLILLSLGVVMVFDASYPLAIEFYNNKWFFAEKQIIWAMIGLAGLFLAQRLPYWKWQAAALPALVISILMLVAVHLPHIGHGAQGAQRWIGYGPVRLQPSEFAKLGLVLFIAKAIASRPKLTKDLWGGVVPLLLVALISIALVDKQPDLGTAITMFLTVLIVLAAGGARSRWLICIMALFALVSVGSVLHKGTDNYRWKRLTTFVNPDADPLGAGYQIAHSTIALGTGGVTGLGFGESREKRYGGLPAQRTDMIFAIVGEEFGIIGTVGLLTLFLLLAGRGFHIAQRTRDPFGSLLAVGITSMIAVQSLINIGVVTASIPATGVPLPFISYGGSSLAVTLFSVGILLNISQHPFRRNVMRTPRVARAPRSEPRLPHDEPDEMRPRTPLKRNTNSLLDSLEREGMLR
jgi:cell division protein FtsW